LRWGFCYIVQADFQFVGSSDPPASAFPSAETREQVKCVSVCVCVCVCVCFARGGIQDLALYKLHSSLGKVSFKKQDFELE
jgi:hypothetical protein